MSSPVEPISNGVPKTSSAASDASPPVTKFKKIILCFDGTGNTFQGTDADTNVVKILRKLDRKSPNQYHYYQTGIGTYDINEKSVNKTPLGQLSSSLSKTIDQGFGTTFDAHVMAGYRFLMRYYENDAKIYMFGFSRGAFTAKFLARMISKIGLLCKGNEEMVPFAYRLYQRFLAGEVSDRVGAQANKNKDGSDSDLQNDEQPAEADPLLQGKVKVRKSSKTKRAFNEISAFRETFCRVETDEFGQEVDIKVYFLGIWDCVNSVAVLERKSPVPVAVGGTAKFVRHAVAVDERRVKFKPALLAQDIRESAHRHDDEDIQEVWFPGNHSDVGGGWPAEKMPTATLWQRLKNFWNGHTPRKLKDDDEAIKAFNDDTLQLSDIPLAWMIHQVELVGQKDPRAAVDWSKRNMKRFKKLIHSEEEQLRVINSSYMHDCLAFSRGQGFISVLMWKFMEWLPFITRWELDGASPDDKGWKNVRFPLNKGSARDIPRKAVLHHSLIQRLDDRNYFPPNNHGGNLPPCLKKKQHGECQISEFRKYDWTDGSNIGKDDSGKDKDSDCEVLSLEQIEANKKEKEAKKARKRKEREEEEKKSAEMDKTFHQTFVINY